jgi:hypothetical protein
LAGKDAFPGSVESELRSKSRVEGARKKTKKSLELLALSRKKARRRRLHQTNH